jgi:Flp pilus assembly protein TadG
MRRLLSKLKSFRSDQKGNFALLFGIAVIPVIAAMGLAVDYSLANASRSAVQAALDNTALSLSRQMPLSQAELDSKGWTIFTSNLGTSPLTFTQGNFVITTPTTTSLSLRLDSTYTLKIAGVLTKFGLAPTMPVGATSEVSWGNSRLRVALVLDNTGSMSSAGKIEALKTATTGLLTTLKNAVVNTGDVYVSIVPFARTVNLGSSNSGASWIDWTDWEAPTAVTAPASSIGPGSTCPYASNGSKGFVCTTGSANGSATTTTIPSSGTYKGYICPSIDNGQVNSLMLGIYYNGCYNSSTYTCTGSTCTCTGHSSCTCTGNGSSKNCKQPATYFEHSWIPNAHSTWNGCVADRGTSTAPSTNAGYDQKIDAPIAGNLATLFPAQQYAYCNIAVMGLSYDWTSLNNLVSAMTPNGSTNQPIGLVWGWQSLVGGGALTAPALAPNYVYNQVIILLSDGLNTQDRWYGDGSTTNTSVDGRMYYNSTISGTCKNIKDTGIKIYAVQVNTGGDATSALLRNCATDPSMFFELKTAGAIVTTFDQIGTALANLHLSK